MSFSRILSVHSLRLTAVALLAPFLISPALRAAPPNKPAPTKANVSYGPDPHQIMDIYVPATGTGPFPVVIWYGGIWKASKGIPDLNSFGGKCAVIGVETRAMEDATKDKISPPISVVLLDARRALQFIRLHAADWNLDPEHIATAGGSQGTLPALYVGCAGEMANPASADPVERVSTKVTCVGAWRSQPSIDPKQMQAWVPGVVWGAPSFGCSFEESLQKRDQLMPLIKQWSPDELVHQGEPPIFFQYNWGLTQPADVKPADYKVHSPLWGLGFQKVVIDHGAACYVDFPGHPPEKFNDVWDFLVKELTQPAS